MLSRHLSALSSVPEESMRKDLPCRHRKGEMSWEFETGEVGEWLSAGRERGDLGLSTY